MLQRGQEADAEQRGSGIVPAGVQVHMHAYDGVRARVSGDTLRVRTGVHSGALGWLWQTHDHYTGPFVVVWSGGSESWN